MLNVSGARTARCAHCKAFCLQTAKSAEARVGACPQGFRPCWESRTLTSVFPKLPPLGKRHRPFLLAPSRANLGPAKETFPIVFTRIKTSWYMRWVVHTGQKMMRNCKWEDWVAPTGLWHQSVFMLVGWKVNYPSIGKKNAFAGQTGIENFDSDIRKDTAYYLHYRLTLSLAIGPKSNILCVSELFFTSNSNYSNQQWQKSKNVLQSIDGN